MDVGFIIKQARLRKGLSQEELGEMVGVQKSAVAKWENGRVSEIKRSNLKKLADALGLKPSQLLGDIETDPVEETPTVKDDGLSKEKRELIEAIKKLPEDKILLLLQVAKSIK